MEPKTELLRKAEESKLSFKKWNSSPQSTSTASCGDCKEEAVHRRRIYERIIHKNIRASDFKNKQEIVPKIREMPLSAKTVRDRTIKMAENISSRQIDDINSAQAFSVACDESSERC